MIYWLEIVQNPADFLVQSGLAFRLSDVFVPWRVYAIKQCVHYQCACVVGIRELASVSIFSVDMLVAYSILIPLLEILYLIFPSLSPPFKQS